MATAINPIVLETGRLKFKNSDQTVKRFFEERFAEFDWSTPVFLEKFEDLARVAESAGSGFYVFLRDTSPLIDCEEIALTVSQMQRYGDNIARTDGLIPGTDALFSLSAEGLKFLAANGLAAGLSKAKMFRSDRQREFNNQFNLFKYKRLKVFLSLVRSIPGLAKMTIPAACAAFAKDEAFSSIVGYASGAPMLTYSACPHCAGELRPLKPSMSQPFCGFIPASRGYYHECQGCGLVLLSPRVEPSEVHKLYDEFDKQDFSVSLNNSYVAENPRCDFSHFSSSLPASAHSLDLGGGMGKFSQYLRLAYPKWQVTHSDFEIKKNPELEALGIKTRALNFLEQEIGENEFDLISAWEVIEHIPYEKLDSVLARVYRALKPGGVFVFSTPDFDSPVCKAFDFYNACPPFHYTVFGKRWLQNYLNPKDEWEILPMRWCSDFLDDAVMWYDYAANTSPGFQLRGLAEMLKAIFQTSVAGTVKKELLKQGLGTEIIVTMRKR